MTSFTCGELIMLRRKQIGIIVGLALLCYLFSGGDNMRRAEAKSLSDDVGDGGGDDVVVAQFDAEPGEGSLVDNFDGNEQFDASDGSIDDSDFSMDPVGPAQDASDSSNDIPVGGDSGANSLPDVEPLAEPAGDVDGADVDGADMGGDDVVDATNDDTSDVQNDMETLDGDQQADDSYDGGSPDDDVDTPVDDTGALADDDVDNPDVDGDMSQDAADGIDNHDDDPKDIVDMGASDNTVDDTVADTSLDADQDNGGDGPVAADSDLDMGEPGADSDLDMGEPADDSDKAPSVDADAVDDADVEDSNADDTVDNIDIEDAVDDAVDDGESDATRSSSSSSSDSKPAAPSPRIFCWVMTDKELMNKTTAVKDTWVKHCDGAIAISSTDDGAGTQGVDAPRGRDHIAGKSKLAWVSIYKQYIDKADYFIKADPDTFVFVDNLKRYLAGRDPDEAEYFGHVFKPPLFNHTYMSGGSGYVLSRQAVRLLVEKAFKIKPTCIPDGQGEDVKIGDCLSRVGVEPVDTRDTSGRETFLPFHPSNLLLGLIPDWYKVYDVHGAIVGEKCCSHLPISFHYLEPKEMYLAEYMAHTVQTADENTKLSFIKDGEDF